MKKKIQYGAKKVLGSVPIRAYKISKGKLPRTIQIRQELLNLAVQIHDANRINVPVGVLELLQCSKFDLPRIFPAKPRKKMFREKNRYEI